MKLNRSLQLILLLIVSFSCGKKSENFNSDFNLYKDYILNFSSGLVSSESDFRVVLAFDNKEWTANQELDSDLFSINPSVSGKVMALSTNTVAFIPSEKLKQDTEYQITFHLDEVKNVPDKLEEFNFTIKTIKQDFLIKTLDLQSYSKEYQYLNATISFSDDIDVESVLKIIKANQGSDDLKIKIDKDVSNPREFKFVIDSIKRKIEDSKIDIVWDGSVLDIDQQGLLDFEIPGKNNFKVISSKIQEDNAQVLLINFSDPLKIGQNLEGLIQVESATNLKFATAGNLLKVFFNESLKGELLVEVFQGIENEEGNKMKYDFAEKVTFDQVKPEIRFIKSGTILPSSNNLKINFEAVNLKAVDVKIYQIYKNNILQFLQYNDLNGSQNLRNVAQPIVKQTITLKTNNLANYGEWNAYALDLSKIISVDPGAIYRVELNFKKKHSLYKCATTTVDEDEEENDDKDEVRSNQYYYDDYDYYDDYNWNEVDDPCTNSYYYNKSISTNVIATDLGVIAKRGENGSYFFAVNNIVTTEPVAGAVIDLYNFQQQKLATIKTDVEGIVNADVTKYAYFAIVTKDNNTTYVKLDEGQSLSVSNFDVGGEQLQKGLKGYIYGERGVWRPGDTLHIAFMLNDNESKLEKTHPIKFKLSNPQGKAMYVAVQKYNENNHYKFKVVTKDSDITGNWEAKISIGGVHFYKSIKIETIKPNRLKIKNSFADGNLSGNKPNNGTIEVAWLHGAIAKNLKVDMQAKFMQQVTAFKGFSTYDFDDEVRKFSTEEVNVFSGKVDDYGRTNVSIQPKITNQAPGKLKVVFQTKAYETGGDFSTDVVTATYSPFKTYVGIKSPEPNKYGMLETEKMNRFDIVSVDENGNPKAVKNLEVRVYKVDWRWWWNSNGDDLSRYNSSEVTTAYKNFNVSTNASGKASVQFKVSENEWGRYLIRVVDNNGGHASSKTEIIDWPIWSGKTKSGDASTANMLVFTSDKTKYAVGEKATVSFPSSEGGRALISIENGSKVIKSFWAMTQKGETKVEIPVTAEMAPNVYINISLLKPHASTLNDTPIRMYGILPIEVVDKNTVLQPQIAMASVLKPETKTTIKVSEKSGKEMTYTLAIVDDGLLDLTRFKTPNAWDKFYARQALGVKTWDVYDDVIGAYGGKINQIFSIGGDEDLGGGNAKKANRFKPVVIYLGPYKLEKGQTKSHTVTLPNYIGSVRTMVVAGNAKLNAYGSVEKTTPVRKPLMVLASVPRKISPNEKVTLPITVFAMENHVKNVTVQIKTNNAVRVVSASKQNVSFSSPDEKKVYFDLEVGNVLGIGKIEIIATSGNEKATYEVELDVTNPNPVTNDFVDVVVEPNSSQTISWDTFGVNGSNKANIEISSFPTIDFNGRIQYLIQYPHGCVEQTTSSVFPQLYLGDVMDLDSNRKAEMQKNINAGIQKLGGFQQTNGGLSYWPGNSGSDDWGTSYAGHFLIEAEKKGYVLPISFKQKWISYQQSEAKKWRYYQQYHNDFAQAYRLYTLALAGVPDMGSMNRLRETSGISNESKTRLAATYALTGQKKTALALLNATSVDDSNNNYYYYYGSQERNQAMLLETYLLVNDNQKAFGLATKIANSLSSKNYMSTQTTAYCLYAMSKFAIKNGGKGINASFTNNGKSETINSTKSIADRKLVVKNGSNSVTIKNNKDNTIYVRVLNSGILPVGEEKVMQNNFFGNITFKTRNGNTISLNEIKQGTEIVAQVTIRNQSNDNIENVALSQIIPSGFEIMNSRYTDFGNFAQNKADYIDIRDDRTQFYFGLRANESRTFTVLLNATYLGDYYFPGIQCEAMYDNNYIVRTKGEWVKIVKD
ncbi:MG2 domain-containing protein [uncultured Flavobacterium sp.]|uniref:alpha-2-macroglobulin family protein n=1 Tax=uncultured Flavobacterium sp. TaxID=165435 RepID=UPI0030EBB3EF|tara:strand:- start:3058 stop:8553 length:5496 start_codon:yes stop_codon:yes gene_type:complete